MFNIRKISCYNSDFWLPLINKSLCSLSTHIASEDWAHTPLLFVSPCLLRPTVSFYFSFSLHCCFFNVRDVFIHGSSQNPSLCVSLCLFQNKRLREPHFKRVKHIYLEMKSCPTKFEIMQVPPATCLQFKTSQNVHNFKAFGPNEL